MRLVRYTYPFRTLATTSGGGQRSPWSGLENEIDRLFATALSDFGSTVTGGQFAVDLYEDKDNTYVRAELPGVSRDDINVEVVDEYLTIAATRKLPAADGQPEETVALTRSVSLGADVQADRVTAAYEHGVLTVTLPKREEAKPKKISVSVK